MIWCYFGADPTRGLSRKYRSGTRLSGIGREGPEAAGEDVPGTAFSGRRSIVEVLDLEDFLAVACL